MEGARKRRTSRASVPLPVRNKPRREKLGYMVSSYLLFRSCKGYSARIEGCRMRIMECDPHSSQQSLAMIDILTAESLARARVWGEVKEEGRTARVQTKARTRELRPGFIAQVNDSRC